jgi:hypothetical protein
MLEAQTVSISIPRPWREVYEAVWRPQDFARWASGLSKSSLEQDGDAWRGQGPEGPIGVRFTDHNAFGVMDHIVDLGVGPEVYLPMRIIANEDGAEALLTVLRQPKMSQEKFAADVEWVKRDLLALKALFAS